MLNAISKSKTERNSFVWITILANNLCYIELQQYWRRLGQALTTAQRWTAGGKVLPDLITLFSYTTPKYRHQGGTYPNRKATPTPIINQRAPHRLAFRPMWWKNFLNWGFIFQTTSLQQVEKTNLHMIHILVQGGTFYMIGYLFRSTVYKCYKWNQVFFCWASIPISKIIY